MTTPENIAPELSPLEQVKQIAAATLSDQELSRLATWARLEEPQRRKEDESARSAAASATEEVVRQVWELQPNLKPDYADSPAGNTPEEEVPAWVKPAGDLNSYPDGAHVLHQEKVWRNDLGTLNLSTPGEGPGWSDVTPIIADGTREAPYTWEAGFDILPGQYVNHDDNRYVALTAHTTVDQERPDKSVGKFYERIG